MILVDMSSLQKTNRLLQIFLGAFLLIAFRIWHLAVIQRDEKLLEAQKPQRRTIIQQANRGTITDRYGVPLAINRICYNAAIYYSQFSQIPTVVWTTDENGQKTRCYKRKNYIRRLSEVLGQELSMDPGRIEDLIHSKASLFPHVPFIICPHISEQKYYRLKALEREWLGLRGEIALERTYPLGKTASSIIGHLGAISQKEYLAIAEELDLLQQMISEGNEEESLVQRYQELKEKAYTLNDLVGKAGIEKQYEKELRGFYGKKIFEIDQKGNCLHELAGSKPAAPGQTVVLSISAELQQFCESLLIQSEKTREKNSWGIDPITKMRKQLKQPWIKGGAIVVVDPNNGEVLALAGAPRFDPNDFILTSDREQKISHIRRWQESDSWIASLWDGKEQLYREEPSGEATMPLSWETYLQWTLPADSALGALWNRVDDIKSAIQMQEDFEALLYFANHPDPALLVDLLFPGDRLALPKADPAAKEKAVAALRSSAGDTAPRIRRLEHLLGGIPHNADKLFAIDISRMAVYGPAFSDEVMAKVGSIKLSTFRSLTQSLLRAEETVHSVCRKRFSQTEFATWRSAHQKEFLEQKRNEEKEKKTYARPYLDYLDQQEKKSFEELWQKIRLPLLAALTLQNPTFLPDEAKPYFDESLTMLNDWALLRNKTPQLSFDEMIQWLKTMRPYRELDRPLLGSYRLLRGKKGEQTEQNLAAAFYPIGGFGFSRCHAFQSAAPMGSLFKLVTGYEAMRQHKSLPTLVDTIHVDAQTHSLVVAMSSEHQPYYRHYKGGRLPHSHLPDLGTVDILGALEQSSNPYFAILAGDYLANPNDLARAAADFGIGERSGIDLPSELKGKLPSDLSTNRTGLYSFAIGQHTLVTTPLQAASMLSAIANGGHLLTPRLARSIEGSHLDISPLCNSTHAFLAEEELSLIGVDFPLFTTTQHDATTENHLQNALIKRTLSFPPQIRNTLLDGMDRVVWGSKGSARPGIIKGLYGHPVLMHDFLELQHQMIGKTSTAEILAAHDINPSSSPQIYKHIWFGAIAFPPPSGIKSHKDRWSNPELVVVVYLRYGDGGKEAAPLAAQVIRKWREIQNKHQ